MNALLLLFFLAWAQAVPVNTDAELQRLLKTLDKDKDEKITVKDGAVRFELRDRDGRKYPVDGVYYVSNLLQELKLAQDGKKSEVAPERIFESPVIRISRSIKERYWDALTRRIDKDHLQKVLGDSKVNTAGHRYLYVPYHDKEALEYFQAASVEQPKLKLKVVRLPETITGEFVRDLRQEHGLLALALTRNKNGKLEGVPYVVPGGRFNEMYGWDSYFEALGLIRDGRVDLARAMVDNFVYQITHYGKILNANRTYYLTRSQPPFLTSMIRAVLAATADEKEKRTWLVRPLRAAIQEYRSVWMGEDRLTETGLSRYYGKAPGIPPEVEPGHYSAILAPFAKKHKLTVHKFKQKYEEGKINEPELDLFFFHDRAVRESGHDTTYRWRVEGKDRCADFATVDLNSLLYKIEIDLAELVDDYYEGKFEGLRSSDLRKAAADRKVLMMKYLWDPQKRMFFDYNTVTKKRSDYVSATGLWPLWAGLVNEAESKDLIRNTLMALEAPGGVAATAQASLQKYGDGKHPRQWEWPTGWAPHQLLIWEGLLRYGQRKTADRLIYKWLFMITKNVVDHNGTIPEKYDVVNRSHAVFAEYGNVGTDFSYITREGFGWMNATYQVGLSLLDPAYLPKLERLTPPEWISFDE